MPTSDERQSDPEGLISQVVKIVETARDDLNGSLGTVISYNVERNRYSVNVWLQNVPQIFSLKPGNLIKASAIEKAKYSAQNMFSEFQRLQKDPRVRDQIRTMYQSSQRFLPSFLSPERFALLSMLLFILGIKFLGLSKMFMLLSLLSLPIVVSLEDIQRGTDMKSIVRNFPKNLRKTVVQTTGFTGVSEKVALVGFAIVVCLSIKILVTNPTPLPRQMTRPPTPVDVSSMNSFSAEDMYKLGYDDGIEKKSFGTSLPAEASLILPSEQQGLDANLGGGFDSADDINWQYNSPSPPKSPSSGFGTASMLSLFHLGRTVKNLATGPDGRLNPQIFVANARMMEPMQMGLVGLSAYGLLKAFF
mmetsp:Transcript_38576/g.44958  ORF Transcript_38576/g.44958 Transcript_38576/m.44958 type:complete len:361 (-) Transcript_38576:227-1309(-)|eukprot:CAMPEP_0194373792 /NCGR_PEP_ID=MMETSP0174-20130528/22228_1 /TAXON_ID=216777 /ORGANISM="Proboscia alata, Strain PI-D3" /LENGTH=360 /DNA_ID=CAMNT_0039153053 /DNA_START=79 /DNA_END=1161 /DNA_ORIENTATION=-